MHTRGTNWQQFPRKDPVLATAWTTSRLVGYRLVHIGLRQLLRETTRVSLYFCDRTAQGRRRLPDVATGRRASPKLGVGSVPFHLLLERAALPRLVGGKERKRRRSSEKGTID